MTPDREAIIKEREFIKRNGSADMVDGYVPERPYSVVNKKYSEDNFLKIDQTSPQKVINRYPINASMPTFTYTAGVLTRVDYPSGFYKVLAYNLDGTLNTITYSNGTVKTMNWSGGLLQSIGVA